jgi:hypothetical protein
LNTLPPLVPDQHTEPSKLITVQHPIPSLQTALVPYEHKVSNQLTVHDTSLNNITIIQ